MHPIFISYRRDDGSERAQLIAEHLKKNFGEDRVFLDTSRLNSGAHFPTELENAVKAAKLVIAMIGPNWRGIDKNTDRLKEEEDWVRKELELAIANTQTKIFPVLVNGAGAKESFDNLPDSINGISDLNAITLRNLEFERDILPLVGQIAKDLDLENPLKDHPYKDGKYRLPAIPFKGLEYFEEKDVRVFFGRGIEIRRLINFLVNSEVQILLFFGYSGVGKSSLLFAGLKPRLENKGWKVLYFRRDKDKDAFNEVLANTQSVEGNQLVILDQFEEIFTDPRENEQSEIEKRELIGLVSELVKNEQIKVMISFRKEYLAEIKELFKGQVMEEEFLEPLNSKGILEAIEGLTHSTEYTDTYALSYEENEKSEKLSHLIGKTILGDSTGNKAPLLQLLLRKMWDKVPQKPRRFTFQLFEEVKSQSLKEFVSEQLKSLAIKFQEESDSGLVLELLFYFTTARGTSAQHPFEKLEMEFPQPRLRHVLEELKSLYILIEIDSTESSKTIYRLGHDSLAPIVREMHDLSNLPGQKASRILNSKKREIEDGDSVEFSKTDIKTLEAGKLGTRAWTKMEEDVYKENLERVSKEEKELEEKNIELSNRLARNYWEMGKRAKSEKDFTKLLHLHGKALESCNDTKFKNFLLSNAQFFKPEYFLGNRFGDDKIIKDAYLNQSKSLIISLNGNSASLWETRLGKKIGSSLKHEGKIIGVEFNKIDSRILTWSEKEYKLWNSNNGKQIGVTIPRSVSTFQENFFNKGGNRFVTCNRFELRLWNSENGEPIGENLNCGAIFEHFSFNPDGSNFLTWSKKNILSKEWIITLWDSDTGRKVANLIDQNYDYKSVIFNSDGSLFITWGGRDVIIRDSKKLTIIGKPIKLSYSPKQVLFNTDENTIKTLDHSNIVEIWDIKTGMKISSPLEGVGGKFLTWSDNSANLWDSNTGKRYGQPLQHEGRVMGAIFNFDESRILTWSYDGKAKLWSTIFSRKIGKDMVHDKEIYGAMFNEKGSRILTWSRDGKVNIWDGLTGVQIGNSIYYGGDVGKAYFQHNVINILTWGRDGIRCWQTNKESSWGNFLNLRFKVTRAEFKANGRRIIAWSEKFAWVFDSSLGKYFYKELYFGQDLKGVLSNEEGSLILTWSKNNDAKVWEFNTGIQIGETIKHTSQINGALFNRNESLILTWSEDENLKLWESKTGKQVGKSMEHGSEIIGATFNKAENRILTWCNDGKAKLWNIYTTEKEGEDMLHFGPINGAIFNKDDDLILTWGQDKTVRLWDGKTGMLLGELLAHKSEIYGASFSKKNDLILVWSEKEAWIFESKNHNRLVETFIMENGIFGALFNEQETKILIYGKNEARLWEIKNGNKFGKVLKHFEGAFGAEFNSDGSRILTWDYSGYAALWDGETCEQIGRDMEHGNFVNGATFNPQQNQILTWSDDGTARLWNIQADIDFPPEHFSLQVEVLTGTTLNMNTFEVEVLEPELLDIPDNTDPHSGHIDPP